MHNDMLIIGGGLAGASLAGVQARRGVRVLVIERERRFRDRVRGEGLLPWGVIEARRLGIHESLAGARAHDVPWWTVHWGGAPASRRNLVETTMHRVGCLGFYHPAV
jgi:menaquinone-9 beta-reductase